MRARIVLAAALCGAIGALCGMAEAAATLFGVPWWPLAASDVAKAALLYGALGVLAGALWAVLSRRLEQGRFVGRTAAIGVLSIGWLHGIAYLQAAVFPRLARPASLLLAAAWTLVCAGAGAWLGLKRGRERAGTGVSARYPWALTAGVTLLALVSLLVSWRWKSSQRQRVAQRPDGSTRPNVLLIVMDTTRLDALSCYGNPRATTPNLDRLAAQGLVFEQASVTAPWTLPSHASLFTGLYPSQHGAEVSYPRLADALTSLPEVFARAGYQTVGFSNNPWIGLNTNFHQGFDLFEGLWNGADPWQRLTLVRVLGSVPGLARGAATLGQAELTDRRVGWWLDQVRSARAPFFMFINYIDPHFPYNPPEPYRGRFLRPENRETAARINARALKLIPPPMRVEPRVLAALRDLYEGEVATLDAAIGDLTADLRRRGLMDDTAIVVTADHGENIGDHDLLFHQFSVHESLLHVPLVLHYPKELKPRRVSTPVSIADVYPTLLRLAGLSVPGKADLPGRDLVDAPAAPDGERWILAEYKGPLASMAKYRPEAGQTLDESYFKRDLRSIRAGGLKLVWASDGRHELYDLAADPWEAHNLIAERADAAGRLESDLKQALAGLKGAHGGAGTGPELDENTRRELRALGYVQ